MARKRSVTRQDGSLTETAAVVLDVYRSFDGQVENRYVYGEFGDTSELKKVTLPDDFFRETRHSGRPAFVHWVRSYISVLRREGYLAQAARAVYAITQKGEQALKDIRRTAVWVHHRVALSEQGSDAAPDKRGSAWTLRELGWT